MLSLNATAASSTHIKASGADDLIRQPRRVFFVYGSAENSIYCARMEKTQRLSHILLQIEKNPDAFAAFWAKICLTKCYKAAIVSP